MKVGLIEEAMGKYQIGKPNSLNCEIGYFKKEAAVSIGLVSK